MALLGGIHPQTVESGLYIRLPESEWNRMATLYPGKMDMSNMGTPFYLEYMNKGTPVHRAFNTLIGLNSVRQMNTPEAWSSGVPAFGGVASARGMAQFYQACLGLDELRCSRPPCAAGCGTSSLTGRT